jgi:hypothetical protein
MDWRKRISAFVLCIMAVGILLTGNGSACPPGYFDFHPYIQSIEPSFSWVNIETHNGGGGSVLIENNGIENVIIYDENGKLELYNITPNAIYKNKSGEWQMEFPGNRIYLEDWIVYNRSGNEKPGTVVKEWKIYGRVGGTDFTVYGKTVYDPPKDSTEYLIFAASFEFILIAASLFAIYLIAFRKMESSERTNLRRGVLFGALTTTAMMYAIHFINIFFQYRPIEFFTALIALALFSFVGGAHSTSKRTGFRIGCITGTVSVCAFLVQRFFNLPHIIYLEDWIVGILFRDIAGFLVLSVLAGLFSGIFGQLGATAKIWHESKKSKLPEN